MYGISSDMRINFVEFVLLIWINYCLWEKILSNFLMFWSTINSEIMNLLDMRLAPLVEDWPIASPLPKQDNIEQV